MLEYAREIGADEDEFRSALQEVTIMSTEQFQHTCNTLFLFAKQMSQLAYQNIQQQARAIHRRKRAEEALKNSEALYQSLVQYLPQGIFRKDLKGRFTFINQKVCEYVGFKEEEIIGKITDFDLLPKELAEKYQHDDLRVFQTQEMFECIEENQSRSGEKIYVHVIKTPIYNAEGKIIGLQGIFWDITEKQRMEEELLKARKLESVGILAGGIAHDFNNLLMVILGNISLIKSFSSLSDFISQRLQEVEKAIQRAQDLTQQLLTFSKGGAPVKKTISITKLVEETTAFTLRGSNVRCEFDLPDDLWFINVDEG